MQLVINAPSLIPLFFVLCGSVLSQPAAATQCPINFPGEKIPRAPEGPLVRALIATHRKAFAISRPGVSAQDLKQLDNIVVPDPFEIAMKTTNLAKEDCAAPFYAAMFGFEQVLNRLIDLKVDIYAAERWMGMTPLLAAARYGRLSTVRVLIERKAASVDESAPFRIGWASGHGASVPGPAGGETALFWASSEGHEDIVKYLLAHGASVNEKTYGWTTALEVAKSRHHQTIVDLLRANGAKD
jgi:ankyrin repeat protein